MALDPNYKYGSTGGLFSLNKSKQYNVSGSGATETAAGLPQTKEPEAPKPPSGIAYGAGAIYVKPEDFATAQRIDLPREKYDPYKIEFSPNGNPYVVAENGLPQWIGMTEEETIYNPNTYKMETYKGGQLVSSKDPTEEQYKARSEFHPRPNQKTIGITDQSSMNEVFMSSQPGDAVYNKSTGKLYRIVVGPRGENKLAEIPATGEWASQIKGVSEAPLAGESTISIYNPATVSSLMSPTAGASTPPTGVQQTMATSGPSNIGQAAIPGKGTSQALPAGQTYTPPAGVVPGSPEDIEARRRFQLEQDIASGMARGEDIFQSGSLGRLKTDLSADQKAAMQQLSGIASASPTTVGDRGLSNIQQQQLAEAEKQVSTARPSEIQDLIAKQQALTTGTYDPRLSRQQNLDELLDFARSEYSGLTSPNTAYAQALRERGERDIESQSQTALAQLRAQLGAAGIQGGANIAQQAGILQGEATNKANLARDLLIDQENRRQAALQNYYQMATGVQGQETASRQYQDALKRGDIAGAADMVARARAEELAREQFNTQTRQAALGQAAQTALSTRSQDIGQQQFGTEFGLRSAQARADLAAQQDAAKVAREQFNLQQQAQELAGRYGAGLGFAGLYSGLADQALAEWYAKQQIGLAQAGKTAPTFSVFDSVRRT